MDEVLQHISHVLQQSVDGQKNNPFHNEGPVCYLLGLNDFTVLSDGKLNIFLRI